MDHNYLFVRQKEFNFYPTLPLSLASKSRIHFLNSQSCVCRIKQINDKIMFLYSSTILLLRTGLGKNISGSDFMIFDNFSIFFCNIVQFNFEDALTLQLLMPVVVCT